MDKPSSMDITATGASVSTIPTATPIASEIISDFEPDPKFEITPLEKATFDCNDIFLQDNNSSELVMDSENGDRNGNESQDSEKPLVLQEPETDQAPSHDKQTTENSSSKPKENNETKTIENPTADTDTPAGNEPVASIQADISSKNNDCRSSSGKHDADTDHLTATISIEESIAASALVQVAEGQTIRPAAAETQRLTKEPDNDRQQQQQQQYSAIETTPQTAQLQADERNEHANYLFSLSQTSVDAQMEKVIENIVELGEGHEFPHSLGQVEDKEKFLESIHREMTSVQSSIELIADVASKQQSIEIQSSESHKSGENSGKQDEQTNQSHHQNIDLEASATSEMGADLLMNTKAESEDTTAKISPVPIAMDNVGVTQGDVIMSETVEASEIEHIETQEFTEPPVEPIVEESSVPHKESVSNQEEENRTMLPESIVQPVEISDAVDSTNQEPVVEQVSSAEGLNKADKKESNSHVDATEVADEPLITSADAAEEEAPTVEVDAEPSPLPAETSRRKSGRKPKEVKKVTEELNNEESRRSSRRVSSRKTPIEVQTLKEEVASSSLVNKEEKEEDVNNIITDEKDNVPEEKMEVEEEKTEPEINKLEQADEPSSAEKAEKKSNDEEPVEEPVGRSSRSLRVRAPKRALEEESPKVESPKKQVKRSRVSPDLNKSTGPSKSTTTIKLPTLKSRMTISTSDPSSRPGAHKERAAAEPLTTDKKYICHHCGFATDRVNNMVYHSTKSFCKGKSELAEMMKNDIIKQQQAKSKRRQIR